MLFLDTSVSSNSHYLTLHTAGELLVFLHVDEDALHDILLFFIFQGCFVTFALFHRWMLILHGANETSLCNPSNNHHKMKEKGSSPRLLGIRDHCYAERQSIDAFSIKQHYIN